MYCGFGRSDLAIKAAVRKDRRTQRVRVAQASQPSRSRISDAGSRFRLSKKLIRAPPTGASKGLARDSRRVQLGHRRRRHALFWRASRHRSKIRAVVGRISSSVSWKKKRLIPQSVLVPHRPACEPSGIAQIYRTAASIPGGHDEYQAGPAEWSTIR